jgi:hypothetical protein
MIEKVIALLNTLDSTELDKLPPAHLRKFGALCHHWWQIAEMRQKQPKAGVLRDLKDRGGRTE